MREKIFEIPVSEIMEPRCGCPICALTRKMTEKAINYTLGPAMMEPEIRIMTNREGFCATHLRAMLKTEGRLPLALMMESLLAERVPPAGIKKREKEESCFICHMVERSVSNVLDTVVMMFREKGDFGEVLAAQSEFCLPHARALCEIARQKLKKEPARDFINIISLVCEKRRRELLQNLHALTVSFDYRSAKSALTDEVKLAAEATAGFLSADEYKY